MTCDKCCAYVSRYNPVGTRCHACCGRYGYPHVEDVAPTGAVSELPPGHHPDCVCMEIRYRGPNGRFRVDVTCPDCGESRSISVDGSGHPCWTGYVRRCHQHARHARRPMVTS
jgi:hypothetical protein